MNVSLRSSLIRCLGAGLVVLCVPVAAQAAHGEISFSGAVVTPTCAIEASPLQGAPTESSEARHRCGATASDAGRSYSRMDVRLADAVVTGDPLLGYFSSYAAANGGKAAKVVVRTYD